jgi:hypothetical protein
VRKGALAMYRGYRTLSGAAVVTVLILAPAAATPNVCAKMDWALRDVASRDSPSTPVDVIVQTGSAPTPAQKVEFTALAGRRERGFTAVKGSTGTPPAWGGLGCAGQGVAVAVIDSGVVFRPDFSRRALWWQQRVIGGYDWMKGTDRISHTKGTRELEDDQICGYSSRGPSPIDHIVKLDLVTPGNWLVAVRPSDFLLECSFRDTNVLPLAYCVLAPSRRQRSAYLGLSGTSRSVGALSDACALMVGRDPNLAPDTIKTRLMLTARKSRSYGWFRERAGYIRVPDGLRSRALPLTPARSPEARPDPSGEQRTPRSSVRTKAATSSQSHCLPFLHRRTC